MKMSDDDLWYVMVLWQDNWVLGFWQHSRPVQPANSYQLILENWCKFVQMATFFTMFPLLKAVIYSAKHICWQNWRIATTASWRFSTVRDCALDLSSILFPSSPFFFATAVLSASIFLRWRFFEMVPLGIPQDNPVDGVVSFNGSNIYCNHLYLRMSDSESSGGLGHSDSLWRRKSGPDIQVSVFRKLWTETPLEAQSAGFRPLFVYLHCSNCDAALMVATRFATKVWNLEVSFFMYFSTDVLSVQAWWFKREFNLLSHHAIHPYSYSGCCEFHSGDGHRFQWNDSSFAHEEGTVNLMVLVHHSQVRDSAISIFASISREMKLRWDWVCKTIRFKTSSNLVVL